jgi:hypothetical protein
MIVSHKHQFIFIHLGRTGGRSLTMELAKHCGKTDIITPTGDFLGQNATGWQRHVAAKVVRERLGPAIWDKYFTFTVERNPWEKVLSNYWAYKGYRHGFGGSSEQISLAERMWRKVSGYPWTLQGWLKYRKMRGWISGSMRLPSAIEKYTDSTGELMVDAVYRYEQLDTHLKHLSDRLGFELRLETKEGRGTRKNRNPYAESYTDWSQQLVAERFADDLELLQYKFNQPAPQLPIEAEPTLLKFPAEVASAISRRKSA